MANATQLATDYRKEFADFGDAIYMNVSYQGPLPLASVRAAEEALKWKMLPFNIPDSAHFDLPDRVRTKIARIIGAQPDDVAITTGAGAGA
ncbi:MAG: hypothetical protein WBQ63_13800, partial [Candidatus Acidiferrales bacterium]